MGARSVLLFRLAGRLLAVPVQYVLEVLRPPPLEPVQGLPDFVRGLSVIRGAPVPVLDVSTLLGDASPATAYDRLVSIRVGPRRAALAAQAVIGLRDIDAGSLDAMPPLMAGARPGYLETIGILDGELLVVLSATRIVSEESWQRLASLGAAS